MESVDRGPDEPDHRMEQDETAADRKTADPAITVPPVIPISLVVGVIYFFSNSRPPSPFDYTYRVAENLIRGSVGFVEKPPGWLNEFVLANGQYYSVFSLGSVISMVPFALLKVAGWINEFPAPWIVAILAAALTFFLLKIASKYSISFARQVLYTMAILFGTFMWVNLTFGGAWQLALGFAMVGEAGAIYFTVYDRRPFLAGLFFALAFGNRTENLLTAPVLMYLLFRDEFKENATLEIDVPTDPLPLEAEPEETTETESDAETKTETKSKTRGFIASHFPQFNVRTLVAFCAVPFLLGVTTLYYNYIRFDSISDFGHARIPGVLQEPWYKHGIFSIYYIPRQIWEMLIKGWEWRDSVPYLRPNGFGNTILVSSPFLLLALRDGARNYAVKYGAWISIALLTVLLWMHGNSGGWQFGYRYAMVLLPWVFVLLLETARRKIATVEWVAYTISFLFGVYTIWLYHWSEYMKP